MTLSELDWPGVFSLTAHELRSPASVVAGGARMLLEGRLSDDDRERVFGQLARAAERITAIGQQSSDIAKWLREAPSRLQASPISVRSLVEEAISASSTHARVALATQEGTDYDRVCIQSVDRGALVKAFAALIDMICRRVPDGPIDVLGRVAASSTYCDVIVGSREALAAVSQGDPAPALVGQAPIATGGLGLSLVVATAVVAAHAGSFLDFSPRDVAGVRLVAHARS